MKILFLDIDGVLNTAGYFKTRETCRDLKPKEMDPFRVLLLHRILEATGAKVVVSSSWRCNEESLEEVKKMLGDFYLSKTILLARFEDRHAEIAAWISPRQNIISKYAILDDEHCAGVGHGDNFFKTDWYGDGLNEEIAFAVIKHLGAVEPKKVHHGLPMIQVDKYSWKCQHKDCPIMLSQG